MEENDGEVTCLGLTPDVDRRSKIIIEEISQENQISPGLEEASTAQPDPQVRSYWRPVCPVSVSQIPPTI